MRLLLITCCVVLTMSDAIKAQEPIFSVSQEVTLECGIDRSIPDPSNILSLASFIKNESIAKELRLSADQKKDMDALLKSTGGSLSVVFMNVKGNQLPTEQEMDQHFDEERALRTIAFEEILDPLQRDRLQQLAYQIEIARVGFVSALTDGYFGEGIGIEDYQKGPLEAVASSMESELAKQIASVRQSCLDTFASELTSEERSRLNDTIGNMFVFRDDTSLQRWERKGTLNSGKQAAIPNPNSLVALVALTENETVATELGLSREQMRGMAELHRKSRGPKVASSRRAPSWKGSIDAEIKAALDTLLSLRQQSRLKQIAYQIEIARVGLAESFSNGFLGEHIVGSTKRREMLTETCYQIEAECNIKIQKLTMRAMEKMLSELTRTQQEKAAKLLGSSFAFRDTLHRQL